MIIPVVLVAWYLALLYQHNTIPNVTMLRLSCLYQHKLNPKVVDSSKKIGTQIIDFLSKFETQLYSYSHGVTFPHSLLPLSLHQEHDPVRSNGIHSLAFKSW